MQDGRRRFCRNLVALYMPLACALGVAATADKPPHLETPVANAKGPLTFVVYGDTRFTQRDGDVANPTARRALVEKIASENPVAVLIGGDLVYQGTDMGDYTTFRSETLEWARRRIPVFPALGNHELKGCNADRADSPCLENWWQAFSALSLRPSRWYSLSIGPAILALILDSDSSLKPGSEQRTWFERQVENTDPRVKFVLIVLHHPPVRDPIFPHAKDEAEVERYLSGKADSLSTRVIVVGSHVHNYERFSRGSVTYLVSGGGGAKPVPAFRMSGELSQLKTPVNFHYLRFTLDKNRLTGTMIRFETDNQTGNPWSEPDRFEVAATSLR
jgi:Calcineurin-like phosphoesterase